MGKGTVTGVIKAVGTVILLFMSALAGCFAADGLKRRLQGLRKLRSMIEEIRLMIRYEALEVSEIVRRLCSDERKYGMGFLEPLGSLVSGEMDEGGITFSEAWSRAVHEKSEPFSEEDIFLLERLGGIIGSCDCEGQLSALTLICAETDRLISEAEEQYRAKGRLYRALGAIAGAVIAVIVI